MHVERYGSGANLILGLHGWSGSHDSFAPLRPFLPPDVSLYAPDLPGYGRSPAPRQWRLDLVADEIAGLIRQLAQPCLTLLGNCSGGLLGLCAVLRLQQEGLERLVHSILLIDPFAYWPWYFRVFASPAIGRYAYACSFRNPIGRWLVNRSLAGRRLEDTDLTDGLDSISADLAVQSLGMLRQIPGPEAFGGIQLPITILYGEKTFQSVRRSAAVYRRVWPQAQVVEIAGAGHVPLREAPAAVVRALLERLPCQKR